MASFFENVFFSVEIKPSSNIVYFSLEFNRCLCVSELGTSVIASGISYLNLQHVLK